MNRKLSGPRKSLTAAAQKAVAANAGYRTLSVVPSLEKGKPAATVVLENATGTKSASESLD